MKTIIGAFVLIVVILLGWYLLFIRVPEPTSPTNTTDTQASTDHPSSPAELSLPANLPVEGYEAGTSDIVVASPKSGDKVVSPLKVSGQARGTWFFEASAPIKVVDAYGRVLGQGPIQANGDWMTTDMVPFSGSVSFTAPSTATGAIIFENDNPSGQASTSRYFAIPVYFK